MKSRKLFAALVALFLIPLSSFSAEKNAYMHKKGSVFTPSDTFELPLYLKEQYKKVHPALTYSSGENALKWQHSARAQLRKLLNIPLPPYCPLQTRLGEVVPCAVAKNNKVYKYSRQEVLFYSRPNFPVMGYLLLPEKVSAKKVKYAAVICLPGHGSRVDDIIGLHPDGTTRMTLTTEYQHDFAVQCVTHGYAALAIELLGSGARQTAERRKNFPQGGTCSEFNRYLQSMGDNLIGYRVFDVMRAVDFLQTRSDIDKSKIATMGISAGGALSLFAAAVDTRIKTAAVSGWFCDFGASLLSYMHCTCHYVPNMLTFFRASDIAGLVAPRRLLLESGKKDEGFPQSNAVTAFLEAKKIFAALNAPQQIRLAKHDGAHQFDGNDFFTSLGLYPKPAN